MRSIWVVTILLCAGTAMAEDAAPVEPKLTLGASATVWLPSGDADSFSSTSLGVRPQVAYNVLPFLQILGTFDFIFVNEKENVDAITYYTISAGARLIKTRPGSFEPYGEFLLGWHKLDAQDVDDSGLGFRIGGGARYALGGSLIANAGINFSSVSIDVGLGNIDIDALIFEVGLGTRL